ncbi:MAG: WD40 repeat domain-containing protein [Candidatus Heimdallarchaeota archaeon]
MESKIQSKQLKFYQPEEHPTISPKPLQLVLKSFVGHPDKIFSLGISSDETCAISISYNGSIRLWDLEAGQLTHIAVGNFRWVNSLTFLSDHELFLSASREEKIQMREVKTIRLTQTDLEAKSDEDSEKVGFIEGHWQVCESDDKKIQLCRRDTGKPVCVLETKNDWPEISNRPIFLSQDGCTLIFLYIHAIPVTGIIGIGGFSNYEIRLADTETGQVRLLPKGKLNEAQRLSGSGPHEGESLVYSPDGRWHAKTPWTVSEWSIEIDWMLTKNANRFLLWDMKHGYLQPLEGPADWVQGAYLSPDARWFINETHWYSSNLMQNTQGELELRNMITGEIPWQLKGLQEELRAVSFSQNGQWLAILKGVFVDDDDDDFRIWNLETGELSKSFDTGESKLDEINYMTVSSDGQLLVLAESYGEIELWDLTTESLIRTWKAVDLLEGWNNEDEEWGDENWIQDVAFSPNDRWLVIQSSVGFCLVDPATGERNKIIEGLDFSHEVEAIAISSDNQLLICARETKIEVWDLVHGKKERCLTEHKDKITAIAISPDGRCLASSSKDNTIRTWDPATGELTQTINTTWNTALAFLEGDKHLISLNPYGVIRQWDVESGTLVRSREEHADWVFAASFSPDSKLLAGAMGTTIQLWKPTTGKLIRSLKGHTDWISDLEFSPNGQLLASISLDKTLRLWDVALGYQVQAIALKHIEFSEDEVVFHPLPAVLCYRSNLTVSLQIQHVFPVLRDFRKG